MLAQDLPAWILFYYILLYVFSKLMISILVIVLLQEIKVVLVVVTKLTSSWLPLICRFHYNVLEKGVIQFSLQFWNNMTAVSVHFYEQNILLRKEVIYAYSPVKNTVFAGIVQSCECLTCWGL